MPPPSILLVAQATKPENSSSAILGPGYAELLEIQGRQNQALLEVQRKTFEAAIAASTQSLQSIEMLVGITALFLTGFSLAFGWFFKRYSEKMQGILTKSEKIIDRQGEQIALIGSDVNELGSKIERVKVDLEDMASAKARFDDLRNLVKTQEFQIDELMAKTRLALLGLDLQSENKEDRLRAAQAISEFVQTRDDTGASGAAAGVGFGMAVKLLLDCLRKSDKYAPVVEEALYGLQHCTRVIAEDEEAIDLILSFSIATQTPTQMQAMHTLGKLDLKHPKIGVRLRELLDGDNDLEVRALARRLLREAGKLEVEVPASGRSATGETTTNSG